MTANESTPSPGKESSGTADEHSDGQLLAERLEVLAHRVSADLLELAADVRSGEEIDPQDVEDTRRDLSKADAKVRRNFYGVATESEIPADPRERDLSAFGEIDGDVEYLRTAPVEEVAHKLAGDLFDLRQVADRVDRSLYAEDLTDAQVEELWSAAEAVVAWPRDVLVHRTDRDVLLSREEAEARDAENGNGGEGENHA